MNPRSLKFDEYSKWPSFRPNANGNTITKTDYTGTARQIRKSAIETIKTIRNNDIKTDFSEGLIEADLVGVDLSSADLTNANLSNSDWFNAIGLTRDQIYVTWGNSALSCPQPASKRTPLKPFSDDLARRYDVPFENWPAAQQDELRAAWKEYLKPGGTCSMFRILRQ